MNKKLILTTALSMLFYFLCVGLATVIDLGIFKVTNMAHTPSLAALFASWVYLGLIKKTKTFGPITALGGMMSLFFLVSGHFIGAALPNILCALAADGIAKSGQYSNNKRNLISYALFSLGNLAPILTMWLTPKAYIAQLLAEGKTQAYIDSVMIPASLPEISMHLLGIILCALLSGYLYQRLAQK